MLASSSDSKDALLIRLTEFQNVLQSREDLVVETMQAGATIPELATALGVSVQAIYHTHGVRLRAEGLIRDYSRSS